jgi:hypothetical protein
MKIGNFFKLVMVVTMLVFLSLPCTQALAADDSAEKTLMAKVEGLLKSSNVVYNKINNTTLSLQHNYAAGSYSCIIKIFDEEKVIAFYSICPVKFPSEKISAVSELINRINCKTLLTCFEFDVDKGTIISRTTVDVIDKADFTNSLIKSMIVNVTMMDKYLPVFYKTLYGDTNSGETQKENPKISL